MTAPDDIRQRYEAPHTDIVVLPVIVCIGRSLSILSVIIAAMIAVAKLECVG